MPKKGRARKKTRTHVVQPEDDNTMPKSFVFRSKKLGKQVSELLMDVRRLMLPATAENMKERANNRIKDFLGISASFGITHFVMFSETDSSTNLRIARVPRGPTLSFKVTGFSLVRHVRQHQKRAVETKAAFRTSPLVVLNNFDSDEMHIKLMAITFQNMFPAIKVATVKLSECRRVLLFNYNKETKTVDMRHYIIRAMPVGIGKSVKQIIRTRVPKLGKLKDISEYILDGAGERGYATSDSEMEDDENTTVKLGEKYVGKNNTKGQKSAIRLTELGPRMSLQLAKVEKEVCAGDVLYHAFVNKSAKEVKELKRKREDADALKTERREEQQANVDRKKGVKDEKKARKKARLEQKLKDAAQAEKDVTGAGGSDADNEDDDGDNEDAYGGTGGYGANDEMEDEGVDEGGGEGDDEEEEEEEEEEGEE
jgi:ribosome biogenesis protein SSF1/2